MIKQKLISTALIMLTLKCLRTAIVRPSQIDLLKKKAILQSYSERFHVSNVTFPCNQTNDSSTKNMIRQLLDQVEVTIRRVDRLDEADMAHLLSYKGGTYMPEYLATDTWSARSRFPDAKRMRFRGRTQKSMQANMAKLGKGWKNAQHYAGNKLMSVLNRKTIGKRRRRQLNTLFDATSNDNSRVDVSCSDAGEPSTFDANYLHLCTLCSAKRLLPTDRYPSVINEVFCKPSDNGCLGNGNGKCVETIFNVHILKRRDDICRLCVKDSEALAVNEWETYVQPINVGCECLLDKSSIYKDQWFSKSQSLNILPVG